MDITFDEPATPQLTQMGLPNLVLTGGKYPKPAVSQKMTVANLAYVMEGLGYSTKFNMLRGEPDLFDEDGRRLELIDFEQGMNNIADMCVVLGIGNLNNFESFMTNLALERRYHPMLDWMRGVEWDGEDRLEALCATVPVAEGDEVLRDLYIRKWLLQVVEGCARWEVSKTPVSLPHVLVLVGAQGKGKTSWFSKLGAGEFMATECELHLNSGQSKDHQINVLKNPMAELSEIDSTFRKSDVASLKSFISRSSDTLRAPYGRRAITKRRMTVFCGSVNERDFLVDSTGSRRFWPIEVSGGDVDYKHDIDMRQLWAQMYVAWASGASWVLTEEEDAMRVAQAGGFTMKLPEEEALAERFSERGGKWNSYAAVPIYAIMRDLGVPINPASKARVRRWLIDNLGHPRKIKERQNCWAFPLSSASAVDCDFLLAPEKAHEIVKGTPAYAELIPENKREITSKVGEKVTPIFKN